MYIYICIHLFKYIYIYDSVVRPLWTIDALTACCFHVFGYGQLLEHVCVINCSSCYSLLWFVLLTSSASLVLWTSQAWVCDRRSCPPTHPHSRTWHGCQDEFARCHMNHMISHDRNVNISFLFLPYHACPYFEEVWDTYLYAPDSTSVYIYIYSHILFKGVFAQMYICMYVYIYKYIVNIYIYIYLYI